MSLTRIGVAGVSGRMGRMVIDAVERSDDACLASATERLSHDWIGTRLEPSGLIIGDDVAAALRSCDAFIDFTSPTASVDHALHAAEAGCPIVIGSTGFDDDQLASISASAKRIPLVRAGNMSLGVNLLTRLTRTIAAALDESFDIEIVESHHRHKVDAPSGTALMLGAAAAEGRGTSLHRVAERGRDGATGPRRQGSIGFSAIRGGDIVGDHDVIFAGAGERIHLRHVATDRSIYANGAVTAAIWAISQPPGLYDMCDVLGL